MLHSQRTRTGWLYSLPFLIFGALPAWGQDLGTYSAGQKLVLPIDISQLEGEVAIEVDAVDVTGFAEIVGNQLVVDLGSALGDGAHEVTVYLFQGDAYQVLGTYSFSMSGQTQAPAASVTVQATHEAEARRINGSSDYQADSSGQLNFETGDQGVTGHVGYIATTRNADEINGKGINITEYALQFQQSTADSSVTATLGHQTVGYDRILVDALNRRGFSFSVARHDERLRADFFALSAQGQLGGEKFTGLEERENTIHGARLGFQPLANSNLTLSFQTYSGTSKPFGSTVAGNGSGYSFGFDNTARDGRLRYGVQFGKTRWDEDEAGPIAPVSGDATRAYLDYDLLSDPDSTRQVTLGLYYDAVDFDFESLANQGLSPGDQVIGMTADYSNDRLWLGMLAETRKTNFGGPGNYETDRINLVSVDGSYELMNTGRFDSRSLSFGAYTEWQDRLTTPAMAAPPLDYIDTGFNIGLNQSSERTTMSFRYEMDNQNEQNGVNQDRLRQKLSFDITHRFNQRLTVSSLIGSEWVDDTFDEWWVYDASVKADYAAANDWLFSLELATTQTDDPFGTDGHLVSAKVSRPIGKSAKVILFGSWGDGNYISESVTTHEAIVGLVLSADTNFSR